MPAGESETTAPSLEQILWRAMDRFREEPAVVDAEEFAEHIAHTFDARIPEEAFAERFFAGPDRLHRRASFAAPAMAARQPLHVYEFDLARLEYVIVEDKDEVVVVSEFGQFKVENDDTVGRALEAAVVTRPERGGGEPRAYWVRSSGDVVGVQVATIARTLEKLKLRQVSMPKVAAPGKRLASFKPRRRALSPQRERWALQQISPLAPERAEAWAASVGSATRWEQMLGGYSQPFERQVTVSTETAVAVVTVPAQQFEGVRALARSETLASVRSGETPVAALGSAAAFVPAVRAFDPADAFWVQPENASFGAPLSPQRTLVARPLQLGEITGDPWTDWTLTAGAPRAQRPLRALLDPGSPLHAPLDLEPPPEELARSTARRPGPQSEAPPIVAFRAPDGGLVIHRSAAPVRLAQAATPGTRIALRASRDLVPRAGAVPSVALRTLHIALERTAAAGGYRLPVARLDAAPAAPAIRTLALPPGKERRRTAHLAAPVSARDYAARLLISMPFPNRGQLHVGEDLAEALHAYLAAPVTPLVHPPRQIGSRAQRRDARALPARKDSRALVLLDLPAPRQMMSGVPSTSDLPLLLRHAVAESGSWTARPGGSLPLAVREVAEPPSFATAAEARGKPRPPGPGEEEIVIPLPLWARLGRSSVTDTDLLFLSAAPKGGDYRAVAPDVALFDRAAGPGSRSVSGPGPGGLLLPPALADVAGTERSEAPGLPSLDAAGAPLVAPRRGRATEKADLPPLEGAPGYPAAPELSRAAVATKASLGLPFPAATPVSAILAAGTSAAVGVDLPSLAWSRRRADAAATPRESGLDDKSYPDLPWSAAAPVVYGLPRPLQPQGPIPLRFRYVSAPLWWNTGTAAQVHDDLFPDALALRRAGASPALTAEAFRASALVAGELPGIAPGEGAGPAILARSDAAQAALTASSSAIVGAGPAPRPASIVRGTLGPLPAAAPAGARALAQAIEMSIVAAAPPAPPPLASMSSSASAAAAPGASAIGPARATARALEKSAEDAVSHSKIEGSVDAIAQRIYHRIRRRLQSDRERFGG